MHRKLIIVVILLVFLALGSYGCNSGRCGWGAVAAERNICIERAIDEGVVFLFETENSHIKVAHAEDNRCYATAHVRVCAKRAEAAQTMAEGVRLRIEESPGELTLVADKPKPGEGCDIQVDYELRLPAKTFRKITVINGMIENDFGALCSPFAPPDVEMGRLAVDCPERWGGVRPGVKMVIRRF